MRDDESAERNHFKIGEVASLLGVRPHVLRFWEQEFPSLRPKKTRGAHRHYSRANLELARAIRALVVDQGYSIAGARKKLNEHTRDGRAAPASSRSVAIATSLREDLVAIRNELVALRDALDANGGEAADEAPEEVSVSVPARSEKRR